MAVDPRLIEAVIWQESRGNPNAVSPVGASGLMQVMPDTARAPGFGVQPMDWSRRFDPVENKRFGTDYLGALMRRYGGDVDAALAAYNWGAGNADKWLAAGKPEGALPAETRDYIRNVKAKYGGEQVAENTVTATDFSRGVIDDVLGVKPSPQQAPLNSGIGAQIVNDVLGVSREEAAPRPKSDQSWASGVLDAVTEGAAFGFGDELTAAEAALLGKTPEGGWFDYSKPFGERYQRAYDAEKAQREQFASENPVAATAGELGGALATGLGAGKAGLTIAGKAPTLAGNVGLGALEGAAYGGAYGAGKAEGGDRAEGALWGAGTGALTGSALTGALGALSRRAGTTRAMESAPSYNELKRGADAAFSAARAKNPRFDQFDTFAGDARRMLAGEGFHPKLHPKVAVVLDEINALRGTQPDFQDMENLRKFAQNAAMSAEPGERRLGKVLREGIDRFVQTTAPIPEVATGRELARRYKKLEQVSDAVTRAERRAASTGSGGNVQNAIRQNVRGILDNPKKRAGFSPREIAVMEQLVRGGPIQNKLRLLGKLSPSGNGLMAALGLGATVANPMMAAIPVAGMLAKVGADRQTIRMAEILEATIRNGGTLTPQQMRLFNNLAIAAISRAGAGEAGGKVSEMAAQAP